MAGPVGWPVSAHSISDWVTPLRISPQTCMQLFLLDNSLSFRWLESMDVLQGGHCRTTVGRNTPDICFLRHTLCIEGYLFIPSVIVILIIWCCFGVFTVRDMASDGLPDREQAGPSYAPSGPLPGTFLRPVLDIRSERLYDLAPDIPDVMGLRALRPSAAVAKVMSVRDSRCIRVVTPDDHVECGHTKYCFTIWEKRSCRLCH